MNACVAVIYNGKISNATSSIEDLLILGKEYFGNCAQLYCKFCCGKHDGPVDYYMLATFEFVKNHNDLET